MKKRFLSIVLAVLMLLSVLPVTAMAADRTTVNTAQNGIEATKTAKWVNEKEGIAEITITVKGEPPEVSTPEVDAVLVIDLSGSMNDNNKLNDAKAAAKKFVDKFFGTSAPASYKKSVRIAVVGYNGYAKAYADLTEAKKCRCAVYAVRKRIRQFVRRRRHEHSGRYLSGTADSEKRPRWRKEGHGRSLRRRADLQF